MKRFCFVLMSLILIMSMLSGCGRKNSFLDADQEEPVVMVYGTDAEHTRLIRMPVAYTFDSSDKTDRCREIMDLLSHPEDLDALEDPEDALVSALSNEWIRGFELRDESFSLFVDHGYQALPLSERILIKTAVAAAIFDAKLATSVTLQILEDEPRSEIMEVILEDELWLPGMLGRDYREEVEVTLYLPDIAREGLIRENRTRKVLMTDGLERIVLEELSEMFPRGSRINDVTVENDICYVDMSAEFQINHEGTEILETLTIYSIVNSLCELENIDMVQILIEGQRVDLYKSYVSLERALSFEESLILP